MELPEIREETAVTEPVMAQLGIVPVVPILAEEVQIIAEMHKLAAYAAIIPGRDPAEEAREREEAPGAVSNCRHSES
jgi:hypothetical protein